MREHLSFAEAWRRSDWRDRLLGLSIFVGAFAFGIAVLVVWVVKFAAYWRIAFG